LRLWETNGGIYLGRGLDLRETTPRIRNQMNYTGDRHIVWIGNSGAGKSRRLLLPNLARLTGWSIIIVDVKGELMTMLHDHRAAGGNEQIVFNPFGLFNRGSRGHNPLASLSPLVDEFSDDAMEQSIGMIEVGDTREPHWAESFQDFCAGLAMYVRLVIPDGTYADVRALAALSEPAMRQLISGGGNVDRGTYAAWQAAQRDQATQKAFLATNPDYVPPFSYKGQLYPGMIAAGRLYGWPEISNKAARFASITPDSRELHGILSTGLTQTRWIDSRAMQRELAGPEFDWSELKRRPMTVWLVLPDRRTHSHARWLRLTLTAALQVLMNDTRQARVPVAIILDDARAIGHIPVIESTLPQIRGYGLKLITVWQGIGQIKSVYKDHWEDFIGNAGIVQSFAAQDPTTCQMLSEKAGVTTEWFEQRTVNQGMPQKGQSSSQLSASVTPHQIPRVRPQEISGMPGGRTIVFSDLFDGNKQTAFIHCPYPTEIPGLETICALDPSI
jgi:type IV secretion system protein VirD4